MSEASFYFNSTYNKCSIDPTEINSVGGPENPKIQVWLNLELNPGEGKQYQPFILLSIDAKLRAFDSSFDIASGLSFQQSKITGKYSTKVMLEFVLSAYKILKIEEKRIDNFKATIDVNFRAINTESYTVPIGTVKKDITFMTDITQTFCNINFEIPQSLWVTKHLTGLGWQSSSIIELPSANDLIPEEYSNSLTELKKANEYFNKGDYDKVVAHCRSAIDPIRKKLPELKSFITSRSSYDWIDDVNESTFSWLDKLIKETSNFASKTHHTPSTGHFSRHDAQVVQMITIAIIGYAGKCLSDNAIIK
jgi:hypothetical protein